MPRTRTTKPDSFEAWDMRAPLLKAIEDGGGWVNAHCHLDRAYTITRETLPLANATLQEKWKLVDEVKRNSTVEQIYDRMAYATESQRRQGVTVIGSFLDVDNVVMDKSIKAATKLREKNPDCRFVFMNQTLKGVLEPEAQQWFLTGAQFVDIIGGLPGRDRWFEEEHLDMLLTTAKRLDKMVHVHVDQFNTSHEKETEMLARKTIQHGMRGRVVAVHGVSVSAHPIEYRRALYRSLRDARIQLIVCPTAWIDSRRTEEHTVTHNAIAPVEEMVEAGISVALGTDNIADVYKPFNDGQMWTELRFLLESCHYYDTEALIKIATKNGRKALGLI